jgi:hypothetical protein
METYILELYNLPYLLDQLDQRLPPFYPLELIYPHQLSSLQIPKSLNRDARSLVYIWNPQDTLIRARIEREDSPSRDVQRGELGQEEVRLEETVGGWSTWFGRECVGWECGRSGVGAE